MEEKNRISTLFNKYTSGDASQKEIRELLELLKSENSEADLDMEMENFWNQVQAMPDQENVDWDKIYKKSTSPNSIIKSLSAKRIWLGAVAAVLIGMCSMMIWLTAGKNTSPLTSSYSLRKAGLGKTLVVYLSDGSKVTLNSGSELRFPKTFGGKREVYLDGEAFFEIHHNPKKSFLVHSGKMVTSVLGTSFNVMAYPRMSSMSVTVITGKVAVKDSSSDQVVTLLPKQRAVLNSKKVDFTIDSVKDVTESIAWQKGELIFNNATLEEIAYKVGYKYGIKIEVADSDQNQKRITGVFNKQSFTTIMDAVTRLSDTHYKKSADDYIIY
ncbi:FecR family protein [Pedobacter sp. L105]|uniref:FecR family protein n=1 Tax=Pedobacter sp. L105 TaxID=1641871 RepID=UPI00131D5619|nr:FecR domain-containing protein [Pedobacter sp. L105]